MPTKIEWCEEVWNPTTGCSRASEGCDHCYAEALSLRFGWSKKPWTPENAEENVVLHPERLGIPSKWRKPRRVFVNSMSDLFHPRIPGEFIDLVWTEMFNNPRHTFQILTKRPKRMLWWTRAAARRRGIEVEEMWPDWMWVGTSIESRDYVARADVLREIPAAVRFISAEPLLGPLVEDAWRMPEDDSLYWIDGYQGPALSLEGIHWLIAGGESGPSFRPMQITWMRDLLTTCQTSGTAFFAKQDSHRLPGQRGRIPDGLWVKEYPSRSDPITRETPGALFS